MAILGEIRNRIWILFVFVGIALFAFLFNPDQWSTYFKNNPNQGYCSFVVAPKVEKFKGVYKDLVK